MSDETVRTVLDDSGLLGGRLQMYDPASLCAPEEGAPHFLLELEQGVRESWSRVAWLSVDS